MFTSPPKPFSSKTKRPQSASIRISNNKPAKSKYTKRNTQGPGLRKSKDGMSGHDTYQGELQSTMTGSGLIREQPLNPSYFKSPNIIQK